MGSVAISVRGVTKVYPGITACQGVCFDISKGEIHALFGENGAGKSTLVKILSGLVNPDRGTLEIDGRPVAFSSPRQARMVGIGVVHQSGALIENMTVGENLLIGSMGRPHEGVARLEINDDRLVSTLSPREARLVAIQRLLARRARILILDEPTAMLSPQESQQLFDYLRKLADGGYAVLVVSHKVPEVLRNADRVTVLRKGTVAARLRHGELSASNLEKLVWTDSSGQSTHADLTSGAPAPLAELHRVTTRQTSGQEWCLRDVDLTLWHKEVLGIAGRPGSGVGALIRLLSEKAHSVQAGRIRWAATSAPQSIGLVPADRSGAGIIGAFTIAVNLGLRRRQLLTWRALALGKGPLHNLAAQVISRFNISPSDPGARVGELSGGNLQKVLLAREIDFAQELLLAVNPTAGLDVPSTRFVQKLLRNKAASGCCVVVHSEDPDELVGLADRVAVFVRGRKVTEFQREQVTSEAIGRALMHETEAHFGTVEPMATNGSCPD
jgi:ABC-type uncharacterized transport system ATPase subunit